MPHLFPLPQERKKQSPLLRKLEAYACAVWGEKHSPAVIKLIHPQVLILHSNVLPSQKREAWTAINRAIHTYKPPKEKRPHPDALLSPEQKKARIWALKPDIERVLAWKGVPKDDVHDRAMDVIEKALRSIHNHRHSPLKRWVFAIINSKNMDAGRMHTRHTKAHKTIKQRAERKAEPEALSTLTTGEILTELKSIFTETEMHIMEMTAAQHKPKDIAEELGIAVEDVKALIKSARDKAGDIKQKKVDGWRNKR